MCNTIRLHAMFKQASNKYDSQNYQDFPPEIIDDFIYDAELDYLRHCVTSTPIQGVLKGFESNQQRLDMIQPFIKNPQLTPIYNKTRGKQKVTVFKLPTDYYMSTEDLYAFDSCGNTIDVTIVSYQDLNSYINSPNKLQDQLLWSQAYATLKDNELHVFYPEILSSLEFHYVQLPIKTFAGNYNTLENQLGDNTFPDNTTSRVNSLVPEGYCHILIDIAVANVFGNLRDYNLAQYKQQITL
jgi:hypothetical protein